MNNVGSGDTVVVYPGIYREYVIIPHDNIKLLAQGEVVITGADPWEEWSEVNGNVYKAEIPKEFFGPTVDREYFNPFAEQWMALGIGLTNYFTCGCVYLNEAELEQRWSTSEVASTSNTWYAEVDDATGATTITVNFGRPISEVDNIEINNRMQGITGKWGKSNVVVSGFKVIRACGPKTVDFWQSFAVGMYGAISVYGGYQWTISNNELYQCRGVAIDYGNGSHGTEILNGLSKDGEPAKYGYHKIFGNYIHDCATNGIFAYRGAYTEIYNNRLVNCNSLNTRLLSEAYIKDVNGGWGINIHDNYIYSDQNFRLAIMGDWILGGADAIWLDSECDGAIVRNNVIIDNGTGLTEIDLETCNGPILVANNICKGVGINMENSSHCYLVNNLFFDNDVEFNWNFPAGGGPSRLPGKATAATEGWDGYARAMKGKRPGTLDTVGPTATSRFETYIRFNRFEGNIVFGKGLKATAGVEPTAEEFSVPAYGGWTMVDRASWAHDTDFSGGYASFHPELAGQGAQWTGIVAWAHNGIGPSVGYAYYTYGNSVDYNAYYGGAAKISNQPSTERIDDGHSIVGTGSCSISASKDSCFLTLTVDDGITETATPRMTGEYMGKALNYAQQGVDYYSPDVADDYFGKSRGSGSTTVPGPFADLKSGANSYTLWPR
ncbi:MAG: right-handed parallel beta-helix repeat-containing protein [Treponema sp.]|nr:right-handed parallel beta-helix repeat-containing protein [Treponema sp.]